MKSRPALPKAYTENEVVRLVWLAIFISVFSFLFFNRRGDVLLYGDAVAHINIARRVFDSKTPGLLQLGTVWLPLPHLLILPFIVNKNMWQSGMGGSIPVAGRLCAGGAGNFPAGADSFALRWNQSRCNDGGSRKNFSLVRGYFVCGESESDLHAVHGYGRGGISRALHLDDRVSRGVLAGRRIAASSEMWRVSSCRLLDAV